MATSLDSPAAKHSLASFGLCAKLGFVNACPHPLLSRSANEKRCFSLAAPTGLHPLAAFRPRLSV